MEKKSLPKKAEEDNKNLPTISTLKWRCRRGMKELDILLETYIKNLYEGSSHKEKLAFIRLLDEQDPVIYNYFFGKEKSDDLEIQIVIDKISNFNK